MSWVNFEERMPGPGPAFVDPISDPWALVPVRISLKNGNAFEAVVLFLEEPKCAEKLKEVFADRFEVEQGMIEGVYWHDAQDQT